MCLPTRQNGVENRDKAYYDMSTFTLPWTAGNNRFALAILQTEVLSAVAFIVFPRILGGGVPPGSSNRDAISDLNMPFSTPVFRPDL